VVAYAPGMGTQPPRPSDLLIREQFDLSLLESTDGGDGIFNADGTVNMVLIRPCNGRGPGNRIYEAEVLERDAGTFKGWAMFDNHDSPVARKARMGFPRPVSELAGAIRESWWDGSYQTANDAELGFGQGAVIGRCALTDPMEALVRRVPEAIKGSLNAQATNMRMGSRGGKRGWIVEGIADDPENSSFDLVTKAGAGGRVASILEACHDSGSATASLTAALAEVNDDTLGAWLREHRPDVLGGGSEPMNLQEALQTDEVKGYLGTMIQEAVAEREQTLRTEIREEVRGELGQTSRLRGLHGEARRIIEAAKLPQAAKDSLLADYSLDEADDDTVIPGRSLALIEAEVDTDGKVTKTAKVVLAEAIEEDTKRLRNMLRESAPTVPTTTGPAAGTGVTNGSFGGQGSAWAERVKSRGLDPSTFGAPKPKTD
jgi:hypothetical protein